MKFAIVNRLQNQMRLRLLGCNLQSEISGCGVLAQLVERFNGIEEVTGSNPVGSIFHFAHSRSCRQHCEFMVMIRGQWRLAQVTNA